MGSAGTPKFKVILTFHLRSGAADEELRRSAQRRSFPRMLAEQPGCETVELVKVDDQTTLSVQTWETREHWWRALEAVKAERSAGQTEQAATDDLLVSRDFLGGDVAATIAGSREPAAE